MPQAGYIDQSPDNLHLTLIEGMIDTGAFTLYGETSGNFGGVHCKATVIGASHIVSFCFGPFVLHEVFACNELPHAVSTFSRPIGLLTEAKLNFPGLEYTFTVRRVSWKNGEPTELRELVARAKALSSLSFGIVQDFPAGELPAIPKTVIVGYAHALRHGITVETAHSYPNQGVVFSQSQLVRL